MKIGYSKIVIYIVIYYIVIQTLHIIIQTLNFGLKMTLDLIFFAFHMTCEFVFTYKIGIKVPFYSIICIIKWNNKF